MRAPFLRFMPLKCLTSKCLCSLIMPDFASIRSYCSDIAERQGLCQSYLENLMISFKATGLVTTWRGSQGDYGFSISPEETELGYMCAALGDPPSLIECVTDPTLCPRIDTLCKSRYHAAGRDCNHGDMNPWRNGATDERKGVTKSYFRRRM